MSRRMNIPVLVLVFALLLCEINLTATDTSYRFASVELSNCGEVQDRSNSPITDTAFVEYSFPDLIIGRNNGSLFSIRAQTKGKGFQRSSLRALLLFVLTLCFLNTAFRHLRFRQFSPGDAVASSIVLFFIHSKDGKK